MEQEWMISPPSEVVIDVKVEGDPVATQRPRRGAHGIFYTPQKTKESQEQLGWLLRAKLPGSYERQGTFGVQARFYRSNRKRIDVDNLLKTVLDACTLAKVWDDDSQVRELTGRLWIADDEPRTELLVYRLVDPSPFPDCAHCGTPLKTSQRKTKFCSRACHSSSKQLTSILSKMKANLSIGQFRANGAED